MHDHHNGDSSSIGYQPAGYGRHHVNRRVIVPYCNPLRGLDPYLTKALGNKTLFEVRPSPNKGLGVFATVPIPYDTVVMRDELVLRYKKQQRPQQKYRTFLDLSSPIQDEVLKLSVRQNEKQRLTIGPKRILEGEREDLIRKVMHLENVLSTNAFDIFYDDPESPGGLFLRASRINHSCVPNADHSYDDKSGCKSVFANRDIHAGDEITISYIHH